MAYGPGDNAFVIDRPTSEGGDSVERAMQKTQAQFDALYEKLNEDIGPASENTRGLIRLASQAEVNAGDEDAAALTPKTLANSSLASSVAANTASALGLAQAESAMQQAIASASSTADEALEKAKEANAAASASAQAASGGMEYPTDSTFKAMPAVTGPTSYTVSGVTLTRYELKLPPGGTWIYCGRLKYHWQTSGQNANDGDEEVALCGIAAGGAVIWNSGADGTGYNRGHYTSSTTFGFCWKLAS